MNVQATVADSMASEPNPVAVTWARRASILGGLLVLLAIVMALLPAAREAEAVCGRAPDILAFELARSPADLEAIFGAPGTACASAMGTAMNWINRVDLPFFIGCYFLFLCATSLFESARQRQRRWLWGLLFATIALAGDLLETTLLLQLTGQLDAPAPLLAPLSIAVWIKFFGLAAFGGLAAYCGWTAAPRRWLLIVAGAATVLATIAAKADPALGNAMLLGSGALWLVLWIDAIRWTGWVGAPA